jgi:acyl-CoA synthetase (AMP-forming)/AMP-acid ligase II
MHKEITGGIQILQIGIIDTTGSWTAAIRRGDSQGTGNATQIWIRHDTQNGGCPGVCTPLLPGESVRTMRVLMVAFPASTPDSYHLGVNAHRRLLARYKVPREVVFLAELPRNPTGKILKRELRQIEIQ